YWKPKKNQIARTNISKAMQSLSVDTYQEFWSWSVEHKEAFWSQTVQNLGIVLEQPYSKILDTSKGVEKAKWLYGASMNIVDSCFQAQSEATALLLSNSNEGVQAISYATLQAFVNTIANGFVAQGLQPKDVVAIFMPMTYEAVAIYLGAIKAGLVVATIADSFSVEEISTRLDLTQPKLLITQDGFERGTKKHGLYSKCQQATAIKTIVIKVLEGAIVLRNQDLHFQDFLSENCEFTSVKSSPQEAMTILFSSGTTSEPKAIPWDHTTPIKSASDAFYHHDIQKGDVLCWPTNLGWMMGPWLVFASLINKGCIALYDGSPFDKSFGQFVYESKVTMLGVVPSIVKAWKSSKIMEVFDWSSIRCFSSTGEVSNPIEMHYLMQLAGGKPIIEYCGGTEIGGGYLASTLVQDNIPSTFSSQTLGGEFVLIDEEGNENTEGEVFLLPPIMGLSTRLLHKNHHDTYYKDLPLYKGQILRKHGDAICLLADGYYKANGRVDDSMNLGGIKVSSVQIEALLSVLDFVSESAAIAVPPKEGGPSVLVVYVVFASETSVETALKTVQKTVKTKLNPLFKVVDLVKIDTLPRTASKKIKRRTLRDLYQKNNPFLI
ncbi:MAG: AMP-binding protein, partial [Flavicella sp.]